MRLIWERIATIPVIVLLLCVMYGAGVAHALTLEGEIAQGGFVRGQADAGQSVKLNGEPLMVSPEGHFYFGIGRDATGSLNLQVGSVQKELPITQRDWQIQRIDGLPAEQVTPSETDLIRIRAENQKIAAARQRKTPRPAIESFIWPVQGRISGIFGSQRILNGQPRSPHNGVDIAAPTGTPVVATASGVVSLVHPDMFYTGKTVMIDHGFGVSSIYIHLDSLTVKDGQRINQGDIIGTVGATGRATGPHLHWGINWFGVAVDPQRLVPPMPAVNG